MSIRFRGVLVASSVLALAVGSARAQAPEATDRPIQERERIHQVPPGEQAMPPRGEPQARVEDGGTYKVRRGDTLSSIARRHGVSVRALARENGVRDANRIRAGQELAIPGRERAQQAAQPRERAREHAPSSPPAGAGPPAGSGREDAPGRSQGGGAGQGGGGGPGSGPGQGANPRMGGGGGR